MLHEEERKDEGVEKWSNWSEFYVLSTAHGSSSSSSNWIWMSWQPHRVTSGQSNSGHKKIHISKHVRTWSCQGDQCHVHLKTVLVYKPILKLNPQKPVQTQIYIFTYIRKNQTHLRGRSSSSRKRGVSVTHPQCLGLSFRVSSSPVRLILPITLLRQ